MVENIVISLSGSESQDKKTFSSSQHWEPTGANLIVYVNNSIKTKDDYTVLDENSIQFNSKLKTTDEIKFLITKIVDQSNLYHLEDRIFQLDRVDKRQQSKVQSTIEKRAEEERFSTYDILSTSEIWASEIPEEAAQAEQNGVAKFHNMIQLFEDRTVSRQKGWFASRDGSLEERITDWIPPKFGRIYSARLFDDRGMEIPTSDPIGWKWDYAAGYLTLKSHIHAYKTPFRIMAYQYIGKFADSIASYWKDPVFSRSFLPLYHNEDGDTRLILTENRLLRFDAIAKMWRELDYGSNILKDPVLRFDSLPDLGNERGDLRLVLEDNDIYIWDDTSGEDGEWVIMTGQSFSPENFYNKEEMDLLLSDKAQSNHIHDSIYYRKTEVDSMVRWRPSRASINDLPPFTENKDGDVILTRDTSTIYRWVAEDPNTGQGHWEPIVESNFTWKGPVQEYDDLPPSNNSPGDVRIVLSEELSYWWDGTMWKELRSTVKEHNHDDVYILKSENYWKAPVINFDNLPEDGNKNGDIRLTLNDNLIYKWTTYDYSWKLISHQSSWREPINALSQLTIQGAEENQLVFVRETGKVYYYDGVESIWKTIENKDHDHDDRYYTIDQIESKFNTSTGHDHDGIDSKKIDYNNLLNTPYYSWQDPVISKTNLPTQNNQLGDARIAIDQKAIYYWDDNDWILLAKNNYVFDHDHDDRYFTQDDVSSIINNEVANITALLSQKADILHDHDDRYYTQDYLDNVISNHNHDGFNSARIRFEHIENVPEFAPLEHNHNDKYYTKENLQTVGGAIIEWQNIQNVPGFSSNWKTPVQNVDDLPELSNSVGDLRIVLDENAIYEWKGDHWEYVGDWDVAKASIWKDPVSTYDQLPITNNSDGDVRLVLSTNKIYRWNSDFNSWDNISGGESGTGTITVEGGIYFVVSNGTMFRQEIVAEEGMTELTFTQHYVPGSNNIMVWWNGVLQKSGDDYIEINQNQIQLIDSTDEDDKFVVMILMPKDGDGVRLYTREDMVAYEGQKVFNLANPYTTGLNQLFVYQNGQLQKVGDDYTEIDEFSIEINDPCLNGDKISIITFVSPDSNRIESLDQIPIGTPDDGYWEDGLFKWNSLTKASNAIDDINETLNGLTTSIPSSVEGMNLILSAQTYEAYISDGNVNIEDSAGVLKDYIIKEKSFSIFTPDNSFLNADKGVVSLYINDTIVDSFNMGDAFISSDRLREEGQSSLRYGKKAYGAKEDVGQDSDDGIRDSDNGLITILFVSKYLSFSNFQYGKLKINIDENVMRPGYNEVYIKRVFGNFEESSNVLKFFYDNYESIPYFDDQPLLYEQDLRSDKYVSGVRYYSINDRLKLDFDVSGLFNNTYLFDVVNVTLPGTNEKSFDIRDTAVGGFSFTPAIDEPLNFSDTFIITRYNQYEIDAIANIDIFYTNGFENISSLSNNILVNTWINPSNDFEENFYDEKYRLLPGDYFDIPSSIVNMWNSESLLDENDAMVFDGQLQYANMNFEDYKPIQNVDYSSYDQPQYYYRAFRDNVPHNGGKILLFGINKIDIESSKISIELKLPNQTGWLDLNKAYDPSSFEGVDGDGCLVKYGDDYANYTTGNFSTAYSDNMIIMRIVVYPDSPRIRKIKFWSEE